MPSNVPSESGQTSSAGQAGPTPATAELRAALLAALRLTPQQYQHLSGAEFERLCNLVVAYSDIFAMSDEVIGCVPGSMGVFHRVPTPPDLQPLHRKGYSLSMHERLFLKVELALLERLGVIRKSTSPWMSPVVIVRKPNGKLRLTCDFRLINKHTMVDSHPLPTVEEMIASMSGSKLWSQLDAVSGFWQVPVHENDIQKCGFTTCFGNYEWTRMPMGMASSQPHING